MVVDGMETSDLGVSPSAIQEIRINQDPYSAEFSRPGNARVEVITKSGAESVHGQLNLRLRNYLLDARNAFASERPNQRRVAAADMLVNLRSTEGAADDDLPSDSLIKSFHEDISVGCEPVPTMTIDEIAIAIYRIGRVTYSP